MGTRSDIYIRKENELTWIGSTAWDGDGISEASTLDDYSVNDQKARTTDYLEHLIHNADNEADFLAAAKEYINKREDGTKPVMGWPWPWTNSKLTDECYVFDVEVGRTLRMMNHDGNYDDHTTDCTWCVCGEMSYDEETDQRTAPRTFRFKVPDMKDKSNVAHGRRSGLLVIGRRG